MKTTLLGTLLVLAAQLALAGCSRPDEEPGPAQRAGKALDDAGVRVSRQVEGELAKADRAADEAREKVKDATSDASHGLKRTTEEVGKKVEEAGEKIQDAAN
ncbi:MAG: hypothetical protein ACREWI_06430 [Telluria sp.]